MGIAVRQASTGNIVATGNLETESPFGWVELTIGQASLGAYAGDGLSYTLEFIDARHGGWGFTALDTVSVIPEPSTYALFAGLGILGLAILRRRFRK